MGWWRHLVEMPDRERAKALAHAAVGIILVLLYCLGGLSLYLRSRYLSGAAATPTVTPTPTSAEVSPEETALEPAATATLYPTRTPRAAQGAETAGSVVWPTITSSPAP